MATKLPTGEVPRTVTPSGYQVEETTALGHFILKYKTSFLLLTLFILLSVLAYGGYGLWKSENAEKWDETVYNYSSQTLANYKDGKVAAPKVMEEVKKLQAEVGNYQGIVAPLMLTVDELLGKGAEKEAEEILVWLQQNFKSNEMQFFSGIRLASVYEDRGENSKAIAVLDALAKSEFKVFEGKIHLDLGRLYRKEGKADKAKVHFQYVLDHSQEEEFKKMAKLYLD